jgi:hypothetical protein
LDLQTLDLFRQFLRAEKKGRRAVCIIPPHFLLSLASLGETMPAASLTFSDECVRSMLLCLKQGRTRLVKFSNKPRLYIGTRVSCWHD